VGQLTTQPLRTVVVGGGPAGLFYALLAKARMPDHDIVVYERNPADATFGFGVVFSEATLGGLADADPGVHSNMLGEGARWTDIEVRHDDGRIRCGGHGFSAISRRTLLRVLQQRAQHVGVPLHFEHEVSDEDLAGADLIIAADGVNSLTRERHAATVQPHFAPGAAKYIWFATPQPFDALTFIFTTNEHGSWGVHAYPFEDGTSTFIVETDEESWRRSGLDACGELAPGESDLRSKRYLEDVFAPHLGSQELLVNNSKWLQFRTLRCAAWHDGNVVLLGDAAHTAHFSVGSGTKMAMEDALALVDAISSADTLWHALVDYEAARRPSVEYIQDASRPSLIWWERFRHVLDRDLEQFAFHFLTRSPVVTRERLMSRDRRFVRQVDRWTRQTPAFSAGVLSSEVALGSLRLPSRLALPARSDLDPQVALAGPALLGAGLVVSAIGGNCAADAVAWIHDRTEAAVALRVDADTDPGVVAEAAEDGFDVLEAPLGAACARYWPTGRPLLALVEAPSDPDGEDADRLVGDLAGTALDRTLAVGVTLAAERDIADALMFCDRVVQELGLTCVAVEFLTDADAVRTAVIAGRISMAQGVPSLVSDSWQRDYKPQRTASGAT
jgi:anthraniloyl-CoA monooxygenase